jgi:hypothetical protein
VQRYSWQVPADPAAAAEAKRLAAADKEDRAIQKRSFIALAWMAAFTAGFVWLVLVYMKEMRTVDCIDFVRAPEHAPPPGSCKRERTAFR